MSLACELGPQPEDAKRLADGLSLRNLLVLTYTTSASAARLSGRLSDALAALTTVLSLEESAEEEAAAGLSSSTSNQHHLTTTALSGAAPATTGARAVVSSTSAAVQPRTLISISAVLAQLDRGEESLRFARRALVELKGICEADLAAATRSAADGGPGPVQPSTTANVAAALLNVAVAQGMLPHSSVEFASARATCDAALALVSTGLPDGHPLRAAASRQAETVARLLTRRTTQVLE
jgi:hypothetical protein